MSAGNHSIPTSERRSSSRRRSGLLDRGSCPCRRPGGWACRGVKRKTSASIWVVPLAPRPRIRIGTQGSSVGIVAMIGVLSPVLCQLGRSLSIEPGGHEDRTALGIEIEDLGSVGGEEETVLGSPRPASSPPPRRTVMSRASISTSRRTSASPATVVAAKAANSSLSGVFARAFGESSYHLEQLRGGHRKGNDRSHSSALPVNSKAVTFRPLHRYRRRGWWSHELDGPVLPHQPPAGKGRCHSKATMVATATVRKPIRLAADMVVLRGTGLGSSTSREGHGSPGLRAVGEAFDPGSR